MCFFHDALFFSKLQMLENILLFKIVVILHVTSSNAFYIRSNFLQNGERQMST